jgi:hypothetical protein
MPTCRRALSLPCSSHFVFYLLGSSIKVVWDMTPALPTARFQEMDSWPVLHRMMERLKFGGTLRPERLISWSYIIGDTSDWS